ncbi:MAG TPA: DegT/DnrJ/EryC1/StrS family aminotransferase [Candidatus Latescibacteria bacterium]|nr:DegT/DnrJ/EryC1/StrS family aminotransferase [Candidatus Latescibacterota bacterium]
MSDTEGVSDTPIPYVNLRAQGQEQLEELSTLFADVVLRGAFVGGDAIERFEGRVAERCGTAHAVALNSGTDALILALKVTGIGPGDEVITPPNSFIASASCIVHVGARPVFADVLPDQNIDPDAVARAITPRTRAIMPVHLTGRVCRMEALLELAAANDLLLIEDAAQSIGSTYGGRPSGSFGTFGCFSAHPLKNLSALGDAGYVTTDDADGADRLRRLRNHGMADRTTVDEWGYVSRMDTLQAAVLDWRLGHLDKIITRRRRIAARYQQRFAGTQILAPPCRDQEFNTFHTFVVQVDGRDELKKHLQERGIKTTIHYPVPIHLQPAARDLGYRTGDFPETERQAARILTLPVNEYMTNDDVERVADDVLAFYSSDGGVRG